MNRRVTGILAYCSIVGWLIAFFAGDRSARFHLNQGFIYAIFSTGVGVLSASIGWISLWLIWPIQIALGLLSAGLMVLSILGIVFAAQDREVPLPFGNLFTIIR